MFILPSEMANLWQRLGFLFHVSSLWELQTLGSLPLLENCGPLTSLAHILAQPAPTSQTTATIALADHQLCHNAKNPDITQCPERVGREVWPVCGLHSQERLLTVTLIFTRQGSKMRVNTCNSAHVWLWIELTFFIRCLEIFVVNI